MNFIAVTKCISKKNRNCNFHFKGYLKGRKIVGIKAIDYEGCIKEDEEYIIHFKKIVEYNGVIHSEILKIKILNDRKIIF
tara:strand:+ start:266555 stop:266794 length:240 start_codon:yes stop_codon:yes gene_type:complete